MTKKEKYLMENFKISENDIMEIAEIGRICDTHKYNVWIAKEFKKNKEIIKDKSKIQYILDWAKKEKPNINNFNFENAYEESSKWHKNLKFSNVDVSKQSKNDSRILYKTKDNNFYFILLTPEELEDEGNMMKNCVGTYKDKVINAKSFIISFRDKNNESHVTMEIDAKYGDTLQVKAKGNHEVPKKYQKYILEFALYATAIGENEIDVEILDLINTYFE
jgi:hypothetical protein